MHHMHATNSHCKSISKYKWMWVVLIHVLSILFKKLAIKTTTRNCHRNKNRRVGLLYLVAYGGSPDSTIFITQP